MIFFKTSACFSQKSKSRPDVQWIALAKIVIVTVSSDTYWQFSKVRQLLLGIWRLGEHLKYVCNVKNNILSGDSKVSTYNVHYYTYYTIGFVKHFKFLLKNSI